MASEAVVQNFYGKLGGRENEAIQANPVTSCNRKKEKMPDHIKEAMSLLHDDITSRAFGCATAFPESMEGKRVLDLGSGCGRDCFVLSRVVGAEGGVVGLDMTDELLKVAKNNIEYHTQKFGYATSNISFVKGTMEDLKAAGLEDNSFDVIISNCVICLSKDKRQVLRETARVLKPGGELYFNDMYREGDIPPKVRDDPQLWCEGLTGALTYQELNAVAQEVGFTVPRVVNAGTLPILVEEVKAKLSNVKYASVTYRLFKRSPDVKASISEVTYKGGIRGVEETFKFDHNFTFTKGEKKMVDRELTLILLSSRFAQYFDVTPTDACAELPSVVVDPFGII